jgi:hypothetical protein
MTYQHHKENSENEEGEKSTHSLKFSQALWVFLNQKAGPSIHVLFVRGHAVWLCGVCVCVCVCVRLWYSDGKPHIGSF